MDSSVGLAIQCVGILLVALLSFFMMRWFQSGATKYWTIAWTSLFLSLASLYTGFHIEGAGKRIFYSCYFLGEYIFGLMILAGCRYHATGKRLDFRSLWKFTPLTILAALLPYASGDFNTLFIVQASVMSALFALALYALRKSREHSSPGVRVMSVALFLLSLDFLHYVLIFGSREGTWGLIVPSGYFKYTSIFDLILEILLGFATIMVLMEGVRREVEVVNLELRTARDRLEQIARVDPLTQALTRHAFQALVSNEESSQAGCAAVIDVDNLKPINDNYGHAAGDAAIRAVARAVKTVTRADDLLFRWGGDEFLVLMFGIPEPLARDRLDALNSLLTDTRLPSAISPVRITVSHGLSSFDTMTNLHKAIDEADEVMYKSKQATKARENNSLN